MTRLLLWLHGNSIPKIDCLYFWPGLIALPKSTLPNREDLYIYINKDRNPFTKNTRHVDANVNRRKEKTKTIKIVVMKWKT
jgi:hypothetical protein